MEYFNTRKYAAWIKREFKRSERQIHEWVFDYHGLEIEDNGCIINKMDYCNKAWRSAKKPKPLTKRENYRFRHLDKPLKRKKERCPYL